MFFYEDIPTHKKVKMGVLAVEMEAAALYMNGKSWQERLMYLWPVSDLPFTGEAMHQ